MMTYTNLCGIIGLRLGRRSNVPLIISERTLPTAASRQSRAHALKALAAKALYHRSSGAIAISHAVAADLLGAFRLRSDQIRVIPNPAIDSPLNPRIDRASALPSPESLRLLFVGRLVAAKQPHLFIECVAQLRNSGVNASGLVVGDGPLRGQLEQQAATEGLKMEFAGWVEEWHQPRPDCDCLVLPSLWEGFGNVLVEAAAVGIPAVSFSSALGVADAMLPGITGELVSGSSGADLARGVLKAVGNRGDQGDDVSSWLKRFSTFESTAELIRWIDEIAARPPMGSR
jgi:glycosyltransferase involved in cell wall biosynthesis